tara:strand:- start:1686 stop:4388 length:2703 start_codon:yes stop_codon:yes gene_type:complete
MPKQTLKIEGFHGGLNTNADPRDMADIQSPNIQDVKISKLGKIKTLGSSVDLDASRTTNTLTILANRGLFVLDADKAVTDDADYEGSCIFVYDDTGKNIDVFDLGTHATNGTWSVGEISLDTSHPVFYAADGILRVGDGDLVNDGQWFGYKNTTFFSGTNASATNTTWFSSDQKISKPTSGNCLISTPTAGTDTNGVNSTASEYIGNVIDASGDDVADASSINLRVGFQYNSFRGGDHTLFTTTHATDNGSASDIYPLFGNHNLLIEASSSNSDIVISRTTGFTLTLEKNVLFGFWFDDTNYPNFQDILIVANETTSSESISWEFQRDDLKPNCWNVLSLSLSNRSGGDSNGVGLDNILVLVDRETTTTLDFYMSGPVIATNPNLEGFTEGLYTFHHTYLYDESKQESLPFQFTDTDSNYNFNKVNIVGNPVLFNFDIYCSSYNTAGSPSYSLNKRISGSRLYYKKQEDDNYYLIGELDFDNTTASSQGFKWFPESNIPSYTFQNTNNTTAPVLSKTAIVKQISPESANIVDTFKSINGYDTSISSIECKYNTAVVHGRRAYVGNIKQDGIVHSDRMIKSRVNKFDTFPSGRGVVDVAIRDGESIVKLEAFADRILQFKQKSLYVINVSENIDFLEDVYRNKGCEFDYHVVKTDYGITWFNKFGVYLFDGKNVVNLLEKDNIRLISESDWETFIVDSSDTDMSEAHIAYIPKRRQILIKNETTDILLYDLVLRAWTKGIDKITVSTNMTNFALDSNQDLIYVTAGNSTMKVWDSSSNTSASGKFIYQTKDIDFGQPSVRKKIYKVYITYKTTTTTNVQVNYSTNGSTVFNKVFEDGDNFASNELANAGGNQWVQAVLKPNTSSEANNIYSFALKFTNDGDVPATFEINDITIVYRLKNIK